MTADRENDGVGQEPPDDARHLGPFLEAFRPRLKRMVALQLDPRLQRRVDCSDVLQEAFVEVTRRYDEYPRERMALYVWVRLITEQKVKELRRRHMDAKKRDVRLEVRERRDPDASTMYLAKALADQGETPSQVMSREEQEQALREVLERMKQEDREILLLRHFEQLTYAECAEVLGLTRKAATTRHLRAAKRLREILKNRKDLIGDVFEDGQEENEE